MVAIDEVVDQPVELLPEEKLGLLLELLNVSLNDLLSVQGDIDLDSLKSLVLDFADDGSIKLSLVPVEGDPIVQEEEATVIESILLDLVEMQTEDQVEE